MKISDIIKKEEDRIFIVDPECFIIFTGNSELDTQPFIRVGNWLDLPIEIIPLIENIIITDMLLGNPAHEQFNLDIKVLPSNRYIGNKIIVKRFLDFQKIFGLDLHNAAIVDAEKDIPKITKKNISDNEAFIGVFYKDGNFKISHKNDDLFNLKELYDKTHNYIKVNNYLEKNAKSSKRYVGNGMVILEHNPLFYKKNDIVSYLFPTNYFKYFQKLKINPLNINTVIHPSANFLSLTKFVKWRHAIKNKLRIFSNLDQQIKLFKDLFNNATIIRENFKDLKYNSSTGINLEAYPASYNLKVKFHFPESNTDLKLAYIKGLSNLKTILKDKIDCLFINYSVFEDANILLKTFSKPIAIIDDGNQNLARLSKSNNVIIYQNIQYEFIKIIEEEELLTLAKKIINDSAIISKLINQDLTYIIKILKSFSDKNSTISKKIDCINIISILKYFNNVVTDRKFSSHINSLLQQYSYTINTSKLLNIAEPYKVNLVFSYNGLFEFVEPIKNEKNDYTYLPGEIIDFKEIKSENIKDKSISDFYEKIVDDRKRLEKLLSIYSKNLKNSKQIKELKTAIKKRKEIYKDHVLAELDENTSRKAKKLQKKNQKLEEHYEEISKKLGDRRHSTHQRASDNKILLNKKILSKVIAIIIVTIILCFISFFSYNYYLNYEKNKLKMIAEQKIAEEKARIKEAKEKEKKERIRIIKEYNIRISNRDIFKFANRIAVDNGYTPISIKTFRQKDPNWIFPGNIFVLPDKQKITIIKGDTLWDIANTKLIEMYINFYKIIDQMKQSLSKEEAIDKNLLIKAKKYIFNNKQKKDLEKYKKLIKNNESK